jgi:hypothetical protein
MHNQHAGLSRTLAERYITERHKQAAHARLVRGGRPPRRRRRAWWPVVCGGWLAGQGWPQTSPSATRSKRVVDRWEDDHVQRHPHPHPRGTLAAMNPAGTTAQAHTSDDPASKQRRVLGQLELLTAQDAAASQEPPTDAVERFRRGERAARLAVLGLRVLAAALALAGGLAVRSARRANRRARVGQAA